MAQRSTRRTSGTKMSRLPTGGGAAVRLWKQGQKLIAQGMTTLSRAMQIMQAHQGTRGTTATKRRTGTKRKTGARAPRTTTGIARAA